MSLINRNTIDILLYYKEVKTDADFTKIIVLEDEDGEKLLKEQEERDQKIEDIKKNQEKRSKLQSQDGSKNVDIPDVAADKEVNFRVYVLKTQWKTLSWKEQNDITQQSTYYNQEASFNDLNIWKFRDLRIKYCLVSWDLKDDNGQPIPLNSDMLDQLSGDVVLALVSKYDDAISLSDEESKN